MSVTQLKFKNSHSFTTALFLIPILTRTVHSIRKLTANYILSKYHYSLFHKPFSCGWHNHEICSRSTLKLFKHQANTAVQNKESELLSIIPALCCRLSKNAAPEAPELQSKQCIVLVLTYVSQPICCHQKPLRQHENRAGQLETSQVAILHPFTIGFGFPLAWLKLDGWVMPSVLLSYSCGVRNTAQFSKKIRCLV